MPLPTGARRGDRIALAKIYSVDPVTIKRWIRRGNMVAGVLLSRPSPAWNKGKTLSQEHRQKLSAALSGKTYPHHHRKHTEATKAKIGLKSRAISHGRSDSEKAAISERLRDSINKRYAAGWLPKAGRCKKFKYHSLVAGDITVDGTWELKFAEFLDASGVRWVRNRQRFQYYFEGKVRFYTPDFELPDTKTFIEVKGYKTEKDIAKWSQFPKKLIVIRKQHIESLDTITLESILQTESETDRYVAVPVC